MHIGFHFVKGSGENGYHNEIGTGECVREGFDGLILPVGLSAIGSAELIADDFIIFCGLKVYVIKGNLAADIIAGRKVAHKPPCPSPGAAANVGDFNFFCFTL